MGRKQSFTESELLDMTKKLVLEHGYDGFHLKLLSEHLSGARSTIYQYFSNKEEIVAACMKRVMVKVLEKALAIDETDPMDALEQLLLVYVEESALHQLLGQAGKINVANSSAAAKDLEFIDEAHTTLKVQLSRLFERAQQNKGLRQDIPLPVLIGVFFNLIDTPNMMNIPAPDWGKLLFQMWIGGARS
ncbi:TetR/AcrR family transcriptional regulator [Paenibacillus typhae]|uniref:Transcriptional regulator, TetR family n=1 Tax=Paenibacillus typhae TaxID=1174501 RepID=A0A1G8LID9_9BACL|nr:TetR/AcrR family transcriptional regulator [Paenibacillus typhae]SDI54970.1 transcriptional regulator, TetR family [Paenibacillus typhae]